MAQIIISRLPQKIRDQWAEASGKDLGEELGQFIEKIPIIERKKEGIPPPSNSTNRDIQNRYEIKEKEDWLGCENIGG